jgi:membrane protein YdbS with pleckstrin-like domain
MISEKDKQFITYWEATREHKAKISSKLINGLPMAFLFFLPILMSILGVYFFSDDWYTKISKTTPGMFITIIIAVFIAILFFAYFRMHYKWEMNEQLYQELKHQQKKEETTKSNL